jgi:transcriptional regulator with PAS, ATPase and Fis domain
VRSIAAVALARHSRASPARRCRTLLESELFGYEPGAITDARRLKRGLSESADGGTLLLDESGELGATLQAKLLWFFEERKIGGTSEPEMHRAHVRRTLR